jgi:hypothetical protein
MLVVALRQIRIGAAVVRMSGTIDLDRLGVVGDGAVVLAFGVKCFATIAVSERIFRIEADRAVKIRDNMNTRIASSTEPPA